MPVIIITIILFVAGFLGVYWLWNVLIQIQEAPRNVPIIVEPHIDIALPFSGEYKDDQNRFTITPPANWLMKNKNIGNAAVQFINSVADQDVTGKFSASMNVLIEPTNLTVADYAKASESTLVNLLPSYKLIDFKKKTFGLLDGYIIGGTFINNGVMLRNRQVFVVTNGNVYIATAISLNSLWDKYAKDFNVSLYGLRVQ